MFNIYEILSHAYVDKFIFASSSEVEKARRYMPWDPKKGLVINNGVRISNKILDRNFKVSKHSPLRVLSVCRLDPVKDISCFCEIARLANQMSLPLKFEIVGTGEEREVLIEKINAQALTNVKYHGEVKNTEKFYERSHIFISCSHYEALSLSLLEAMSFGMTCIVTNVDGNNDLIENKFNGFLFEKNKASKCIEILKKVISNPKLLYDTGRNAKKTIINKYSLNKMISSIEEVYSNKSVGI